MEAIKNLQEIDFNKVTKIYYGKDACCRCGCGGSYHSSGSQGFSRKANAIIKLGNIKFEQEPACNWINISLENNKAYTLYFD